MHLYFFPPNPVVMTASAYNQKHSSRIQPALLSLFGVTLYVRRSHPQATNPVREEIDKIMKRQKWSKLH